MGWVHKGHKVRELVDKIKSVQTWVDPLSPNPPQVWIKQLLYISPTLPIPHSKMLRRSLFYCFLCFHMSIICFQVLLANPGPYLKFTKIHQEKFGFWVGLFFLWTNSLTNHLQNSIAIYVTNYLKLRNI